MGVALQIVFVTITIEVERQCCRLFGCHAVHVAHIYHFTAFGFFLAGGTSIGKPFLHAVYLRVEESVAAYQSRVKRAECGNRSKPFVGLCGFQRIATASADTEDPHPVRD